MASRSSEWRRFLPGKLRIKLLAVDRFFRILVPSRAALNVSCRETFSFLYSHSLSFFFVPFSLSLSTISRVKDFNRRGYIIFTNCLQFFFFAQYNTFEYVFDIHHSLFIFVRNIYICIERRKCSDE